MQTDMNFAQENNKNNSRIINTKENVYTFKTKDYPLT